MLPGLVRGLLAQLLEDARGPRPIDRGHAAGPMVALFFHEPPALADEAQRVAEVERAGGDQRGVLAEAVAGDEARRLPVVADCVEPLADGLEAGQRDGQDGRLGVDRVFELFGRALETELRRA